MNELLYIGGWVGGEGTCEEDAVVAGEGPELSEEAGSGVFQAVGFIYH